MLSTRTREKWSAAPGAETDGAAPGTGDSSRSAGRRGALFWIEGALLLLLGAYTVTSLVLSFGRPVWSPVDEMAHYDYIDRLTELRLPAHGQPLSAYTAAITLSGLRWAPPPGFDGTAQTMGIAGLSYEAHQPPLYYALLAAPNFFLKKSELPPKLHIRLLSVSSVLFAVGAAIVVLLVFRELERVAGISALWGFVLAPVIVAVEPSVQYGLSNDRLSPLTKALCALFLVRHWRTGLDRDARRAAWFVLLALLTKYSNGFMAVLFLGSVVARLRSEASGVGVARRLAAVSWPIALGAGYPLFNLLVYGDPAKAGTLDYFVHVESLVPTFTEFVRVLVSSSLCFTALRPLPPWLHLVFVVLVVKNVLLGLRLGVLERRPPYVVLFVCAALTLGILLVAWLLNELSPGVYWFDFRHYAGYLPFWLVGAFAFPSLGGPARRRCSTEARRGCKIGRRMCVSLKSVWSSVLRRLGRAVDHRAAGAEKAADAEPALDNLRARFARRLAGEGVEIGALASPLWLPPGAAVLFVDKFDYEKLCAHNPDVPREAIRRPDVVCDTDTLDGLPSGRFDFLIACHVLEHAHDPIRALLAWHRVLKPGGRVLCILPDARYTFDRGRPLTTVEHLLWDFENAGTERKRLSDLGHIAECNQNMHGLDAESAVHLALRILHDSYDTHFHVWTYDSFREHLDVLIRDHALPFEILEGACDETVEMLFLLEARPLDERRCTLLRRAAPESPAA